MGFPARSPMLVVVVLFSDFRKPLEMHSSNRWAAENCCLHSSAGEKKQISDNSPPSRSGRGPGDAVSNTENVGVPSKQALTAASAIWCGVYRYSRGRDIIRSVSKFNHSRANSHTPVSSRERSRNSCSASPPCCCLKCEGVQAKKQAKDFLRHSPLAICSWTVNVRGTADVKR